VSDPALIAQARAHLKERPATRLVPRVRIATGEDPRNINYGDIGHPVWSWRVVELIEWVVFDPSMARLTVYVLNIDGGPTDVPQILAGNGFEPPLDQMSLIHFPLAMELQPGALTNVVNVSTRGWVDAGEGVLIVGFIVQGGEPRSVVVRGLGPSLARYGISEPLSNPRIEVFRGSTKIAENDNWQDGNLQPKAQIPENPPLDWIYPTDPADSAIKLLLPPGAYTVHLSGVGGATGIGLADVFDLNAIGIDP